MKATSLILWAALGLTACGRSQPKHARYLLDSGATGWVKITYNRPEAPELPVEEGFAIVRIPADLKVVTRNRMNPSWEGSEFYYQGPDGKRLALSSKDDNKRLLWGLEKISDGDGDRETFFVGKAEDFGPRITRGHELNTGIDDKLPGPDDTKTAPEPIVLPK